MQAEVTKHTLESPNKQARLKSPQTSETFEKEAENNSQEWVLPITCEAEVVLKNDKIKGSNNDNDESNVEVAKNNKAFTCRTKKMAGTESKEKQEDVYDKIKHDTSFVVPAAIEEGEADNASLRLILFIMDC